MFSVFHNDQGLKLENVLLDVTKVPTKASRTFFLTAYFPFNC